MQGTEDTLVIRGFLFQSDVLSVLGVRFVDHAQQIGYHLTYRSAEG